MIVVEELGMLNPATGRLVCRKEADPRFLHPLALMEDEDGSDVEMTRNVRDLAHRPRKARNGLLGLLASVNNAIGDVVKHHCGSGGLMLLQQPQTNDVASSRDRLARHLETNENVRK